MNKRGSYIIQSVKVKSIMCNYSILVVQANEIRNERDLEHFYFEPFYLFWDICSINEERTLNNEIFDQRKVDLTYVLSNFRIFEFLTPSLFINLFLCVLWEAQQVLFRTGLNSVWKNLQSSWQYVRLLGYWSIRIGFPSPLLWCWQKKIISILKIYGKI